MTEYDKFIHAINCDRIEELKDYELLLHDFANRVVGGKKRIFAYAHDSYYDNINYKKADTCETENVQTENLSGTCQIDNNFDVIPEDARVKVFINQNNTTVAILDTRNTLHFTDFFHRSEDREPSLWFWDIVDIAFEQNNTSAMNKMIEQLKELCTDKVEHIKIETKTTFDKNEWIEKAAKITEKTLDELTAHNESEINAIKTAHNTEINEMKIRINREKEKAFEAGVTLSDKIEETGWKVRDGKLVYDKMITVKAMQYDNKIYPMPNDPVKLYNDLICDADVCEEDFNMFIDNLEIDINTHPKNASTTNAFHPNVSDYASFDGRYHICIGDLDGQDIYEVLKKLPKELETANFDSSYGNDNIRRVAKLVEKLNDMGIEYEATDEEAADDAGADIWMVDE